MSDINRNRYYMELHNFGVKFGPKSSSHETVGHPCPVCKQLFEPGDYTRFNPVDNYAVEVHWNCRNPKLKRKPKNA